MVKLTMEGVMGIWTIAEAKAKFSEVVEKALSDGPQTITRNGRTTAVIVSADEWDKKTNRAGTLADFLANSPLRGADLVIERAKDGPREIELTP